jgi:hypothetical protein
VRLGWRFNGISVGASFDFGLGIGAFAFVGFGDFCNHNLAPHCLPPARVTTIYRQTTVINNYVVVNNTVVHRGIPIERVSAASRVPVPRASVRDWSGGPDKMPGRTAAVVYRPQLQAPARPVHTVAQQVDARHPVIQHAPIAPTRVERPAAYRSNGSAPSAAPRGTAVEAPKVSPWSSGARPSSSPQYQPPQRTSPPAPTPAPKTSSWSGSATPSPSPQSQPAQRTYQPATTTVSSAPAASRAPGYRSDAGSPASSNARAATQSTPAATQTTSLGENPHVYYPKGAHQAAELRSPPRSDQRQSDSPPSSGKNQDSSSKK